MTGADLTPWMCSTWGIMLALSVQLVSMLVNGLLAVRVNAIFSGDRYVKWLVLCLWVVETVVELVLSTVSGVESAEPQPFPTSIPVSGCLPGNGGVPRMTIAAWVTNIVYSVTCFSLITYRFLSVYLRNSLTNELAQTFLRDGAMLFFMVCGMYESDIASSVLIPKVLGANVVNLVLLYSVPKSLITLAGIPWLVGAFSIASYRTILDLRGAYRKGTGFSSEFELSQRPPTEPMAFAMPDLINIHRRRRNHDILTLDPEGTEICLETFHERSGRSSDHASGSADH
ncbi:hypothetical protein BDY19DRAFT_991069 [Irpex rosettiformis]|uniref:Uncharacterized protein n=1 Tax=Irpex rosettiformis TaxID=378272 RepID=A0ACB8UDA4_9APHY|nr:hypothetical protein BDY19DRAFT_991069 [Irpex rosettiformis]